MEGGPRLIASACMGALIACWASSGAAQTMYKCVDDQRRVTYSNITCEKQGLKDAGPVAERTTSMPFTTAPKPAPRTDPAKPPAARDDAAVGRGPVQMRPDSPLIDKLPK